MCSPSQLYMILQFLKEFSRLSPAEQKVFLFCLEKLPYPHAYSGDLQHIAISTGLYYQTVRQAMYSIAASPILSSAVKYIHSDVSHPVMVSLDTVGEISGRGMDWEEIEQRLRDNRDELNPTPDQDHDVSPAVLPAVKNKHVDYK